MNHLYNTYNSIKERILTITNPLLILMSDNELKVDISKYINILF